MARGTLRIYLGPAPGVGTTCSMLDEGSRRAGRGTDVVVGVVETHGRPLTIGRLATLEVMAEHEMDVDAVLARGPALALVDDLAHRNPPGSRNPHRYQDIDELLDAGIDTISTLDVQQLESIVDVAEKITGIRQPETVPDAWVRRAEQIELIDMTPEALRRRVAHGNVYPAERIDAALANAFRPDGLGALRELALLWVADRVDDQLRHRSAATDDPPRWETRERVVVAMTGAPGNDTVIRRASRLSGRLWGQLIGVHVARTDGDLGPDARLVQHRRLLEDLGGTYREVVGNDVAEALVAVARAEQATQIVVGASGRNRRQEIAGGSITTQLLRFARDLDVHVISGTGEALSGHIRTPDRLGTELPRARRRWAWAALLVGLPVVVLAMIPFREDLGVPTPLLVVLSLVVAVAATGGLLPGLVAAVASAITATFFLVPPYGTPTVADPENLLALAVFVLVGVTVSSLVDRGATRSAEAIRARDRAESIARATTALAAERDPLPALLDELLDIPGVRSASVLRRSGSGPPTVIASAGDHIHQQGDNATERDLGGDDQHILSLGGRTLRAEDAALLDAVADQIAVALAAADLEREAAAGEALAQTEALRTGILQAVSHDLRTPLAGIKASVTSLLAPDVDFGPQDTATFLRTIDTEVDRLDRVVGNLLDMSRIQTGSLRVLCRPTALEEVTAAVLAGLGTDAARVRDAVPETLPLVNVDGALLERALFNVVVNALAFQPEGGPPVVLEAAAVATEMHLRVIDAGPGIRPADRAQAFEPFQRHGDRSTQAGVGLGLAIAQGFIGAVGGAVELQDTPGGGLTVLFRLPISDPDDTTGGDP